MGISEKCAESVRAVANRYNYRPSAVARAVYFGKTHHIGILEYAQDIIAPEEYVRIPTTEIVKGADDYLQKREYFTSVVPITPEVSDDWSNRRILNEHRFDGVLIVSFSCGPRWEDFVRRSQEVFPHSIWVETNQWMPQRCLRRDERHAGRCVAEAMIALGYRKFVYFTAPTSHFSDQERRSGIEDVIREYAAELEVFMWRENGGAENDRILSRLRPDVCVIAYNSPRAMWLSQRAIAHGLCCGSDYGLASCDETVEIATVWPGLSRVSNDRLELGRIGAQMLLSVVEEKKECPSRYVRGQWIAGETARGPFSRP